MLYLKIVAVGMIFFMHTGQLVQAHWYEPDLEYRKSQQSKGDSDPQVSTLPKISGNMQPGTGEGIRLPQKAIDGANRSQSKGIESGQVASEGPENSISFGVQPKKEDAVPPTFIYEAGNPTVNPDYVTWAKNNSTTSQAAEAGLLKLAPMPKMMISDGNGGVKRNPEFTTWSKQEGYQKLAKDAQEAARNAVNTQALEIFTKDPETVKIANAPVVDPAEVKSWWQRILDWIFGKSGHSDNEAYDINQAANIATELAPNAKSAIAEVAKAKTVEVLTQEEQEINEQIQQLTTQKTKLLNGVYTKSQIASLDKEITNAQKQLNVIQKKLTLRKALQADSTQSSPSIAGKDYTALEASVAKQKTMAGLEGKKRQATVVIPSWINNMSLDGKNPEVASAPTDGDKSDVTSAPTVEENPEVASAPTEQTIQSLDRKKTIIMVQNEQGEWVPEDGIKPAPPKPKPVAPAANSVDLTKAIAKQQLQPVGKRAVRPKVQSILEEGLKSVGKAYRPNDDAEPDEDDKDDEDWLGEGGIKPAPPAPKPVDPMQPQLPNDSGSTREDDKDDKKWSEEFGTGNVQTAPPAPKPVAAMKPQLQKASGSAIGISPTKAVKKAVPLTPQELKEKKANLLELIKQGTTLLKPVAKTEGETVTQPEGETVTQPEGETKEGETVDQVAALLDKSARFRSSSPTSVAADEDEDEDDQKWA